ncbi:MAG: NAD-dependent epimerase/dehydratase family protein [Planctomycetota bacterium]
MNKRVLITGATGFIGSRLVTFLVQRGYKVRAIVRATSDTAHLQRLGCELFVADLLDDRGSVVQAAADCDYVFHLAAETRAVRSKELIQRNSQSMKTLLDAAASQPVPPRLVYVSSLAAVGPSSKTEHLVESDRRHPTSFYGKSKQACEELAESFADQMKIAIVRPPIVLGEDDRNGLMMFESIDRFGIHFVPGFRNRNYSAIHVDDLCRALILVAEEGQSLEPDGRNFGNGIYFATSPEIYTFSELGRTIGQVLGRKRTWVIKVALPILWSIALFNELKARIVRQPQYLNRDKLREAMAGSWICSGEKIKNELGFEPEKPMFDRLKEIVAGYRLKGWLQSTSEPTPTKRPEHRDQKPASREKSYG